MSYRYLNTIFPNSKLDIVRVELTYSDGRPVKGAEIDAVINGKILQFQEFDKFYEAKNIGLVVKDEKVTVEIIEARDKTGNKVANIKTEFEPLKSDEDFKISFEQPEESSSVFPGQKISFIVKTDAQVQIAPEATKIELLNNEGQKIADFFYNTETKKFSAEYLLPASASYGKALNFKAKASAVFEGKKKISNNSIDFLEIQSI